MYNQILKLVTILALLCIYLTSYATHLIHIKQIVIFGDSYSDNGNTFQASHNTYPGPAYFFGHFLDGPNWAEYFASKLGINFTNPQVFCDFAYGQAQTIGRITLKTHKIGNPEIHWMFTIPDLAGEVNQYIKENNIHPDKTLYILFIGTNDFLNYTPSSEKKNRQFLQRDLTALEKQVRRIEKLGATHLVIFNLRDLQLSPLARQLASKYKHHYIRSLNKMISMYNTALSAKYRKDSNIIIYNVNEFDRNIHTHDTSYQWYRQTFRLNKKINPCYVNSGDYIDRVGSICDKSWQYVFYDRIHQTTFLNKLLSDDLYSFLGKHNWKFTS